MKASDVEQKPGPGMGTGLTMANLEEVCEKLKPASPCWFDLGLTLDVDYSSLNKFAEQHHLSDDDCLREMLSLRFKFGRPLTWTELCKHLRISVIGREDLAAELEKEKELIIQQESYIEQPPTEHSLIKRQNLGMDWYQLQARRGRKIVNMMEQELEQDSIEMEIKFSRLVVGIYRSLEVQSIAKPTLVAHLSCFNALKKVYGDHEQCVLRAQKPKLRRCTEISEVWDILSEYFSFFEFEIVEHIIERFGTAEDKSNMIQYKQYFREYAEKRVVKKTVGDSREDSSEIYFVLDPSYDDCEKEHLRRLEQHVSSILELTCILKLCKVNDVSASSLASVRKAAQEKKRKAHLQKLITS